MTADRRLARQMSVARASTERLRRGLDVVWAAAETGTRQHAYSRQTDRSLCGTSWTPPPGPPPDPWPPKCATCQTRITALLRRLR